MNRGGSEYGRIGLRNLKAVALLDRMGEHRWPPKASPSVGNCWINENVVLENGEPENVSKQPTELVMLGDDGSVSYTLPLEEPLQL
ncbi:uncharacterized protein PADG_12109 [Paracoccidioides brasiliensis Pb18]|uniref:Uncharacterized protein n=2 Tax=Paracoccidioides brasiliensis TaxID=121759 RepID=A0A0A0HRI2_PARBD|nr:uncharacterized protein PADG_12109 [Paracoccidioides brasiliensis Pb18]KGM91794.1 hypothetical protein PADG_12109 [Paracoccidioides brasiliensis Pb18]ODH34495.1 hypothetical protein ACO22_03094 [Paracoccidioides brasiliensis]